MTATNAVAVPRTEEPVVIAPLEVLSTRREKENAEFIRRLELNRRGELGDVTSNR